MGLSPTFLTVSGIIELPYLLFFRYAVIIAFMQYGVLFLLGYYFGSSFGSISGIVKNAQYILGKLALPVISSVISSWHSRDVSPRRK